MDTLAIDLMNRFAERTALVSDRAPRRYLWTDAHAVCNFLALDRATGEPRYLELALRLVAQVHRTLGRHRPDDVRQGWISGLNDAEAEAHPTRGGLRIGKPLPERAPHEPLDDRLEWDRDGQYFHYLTRWMHALARVAVATRQPGFASWAGELAIAAHRGFTYAPRPGAPKRMHWKMSIDLSRPLVSSMGQHDPLDGLVSCLEVEATARALGAPIAPELIAARDELAAMVDPGLLATTDPLGLGGLLVDASRLEQLPDATATAPLRAAILGAAETGLPRYVEQLGRHESAARRLAFRELGLAIGLAAVAPAAHPQLARFLPLRGEIVGFWRTDVHRTVDSWLSHQDINDVMLATAVLAR